MSDTVQGSFDKLLRAHNEMIVRAVVLLLEHDAKWLHSGLYEMHLPDDLRVRLLALRERLHTPAVVARD